MISNAKDRPLTANPGTLPDMQGAILDYMQQMNFGVIRKTYVNHQVVEVRSEVTALACRQPLEAQKIQRKPEGQRAWRWEQLHCLPDLILNVDDRVVFAGIPYRVDARWDFREYGFMEYQIHQDFRK